MRHLLLSVLIIPILGIAQIAVNVTGNVDKNDALPATADYWIAPNPSEDYLDLYAAIAPVTDLKIEVYSIVGRKLHTFYPENGARDLLIHEDAASWLPGTYLVRIESEGQVLKTMRFVKR